MALTPSKLRNSRGLKGSTMPVRWTTSGSGGYLHLRQRIEQLGMAIPPSMRRFLVVANWPRVVVRTITGRQKVRALILPGEETRPDPAGHLGREQPHGAHEDVPPRRPDVRPRLPVGGRE